MKNLKQNYENAIAELDNKILELNKMKLLVAKASKEKKSEKAFELLETACELEFAVFDNCNCIGKVADALEDDLQSECKVISFEQYKKAN